MARHFSTKEARQLIEKHHEMLNSLQKIAEMPNSLQTDAQRALKVLVSQNVFGDIVALYLNQNENRPLQSPGIDRFISSLFLYENSSSIVSAAKQILALNKADVQNALLQLQPGANGIQWFFTGGQGKEKADKAFIYLSDLANGTYSQSIAAMLADLDNLHQVNKELIWTDILSKSNRYRTLTDELVPRVVRGSGTVRVVSTVLNQFDALQQRIELSQSDAKESSDSIKKAALKLAANEALSVLSDVPVEEINRERSGIRVKALRENGYSSMADIYSASVYQLSTIYGISEDTAYAIKRVAAQFAERAKANAKIRLSSDNRTKNATVLLRAVYDYKCKRQYRNDLKTHAAAFKSDAQQAYKALSQLEDGVPWLFFSDKERIDVRNAYLKISQLLSGEYAQKAERLLQFLNNGLTYSDNDVWKDFERNNIEYYNIIEEIVPGILGNDDSLYGLPEELAREIQDEAFFPDGLLCTLRHYQEWGVKYILHQERVLLGDEMGLGKTIQAIAAMVSLRNTGATHFMVVCPASVIANWCREIIKHSKLKPTKIHGAGRSLALKSWLKTGGVAVTTYETTSRIKLDDSFRFDMLVVDEAHYIKNPEARRTINVKALSEHTERLLFMTGTALENKVDEMIALIRILQPSIAASVQSISFMSTAAQFRERVAPVYYRRKREDVLTELPELIESREWCTLSPEEERVYEQTVLSKNYMAVRRVSWNVGDLKYSSKARRLMELVEEAASEERKIIVFSFFLDTIRGIAEQLGHRCYGPINGSVPPARRQEILDEFDKAPSGSVLVSQIQSGGTGLNIQSASVVVICEPQFKPSIENQAVSRAYRMGQARNVLVYRLLCENTVDERITELLEQKQAIFDAFADKSVAAEQSIELDEKSFGIIIQEEIDRINAKRRQETENNQVPAIELPELLN